MGEVVFVRHGQASYGAANYDKLSPLGHQQSAWLGAHLSASSEPFDRIVCGTLRRHRETLAAIRREVSGPEPIEDPRLNEMSYFAMERALIEQTGEEPADTPEDMARHFIAVMQAWVDDRLPDQVESFTSFEARVLEALQDHSRLGERVLMVSSGGPKGVLMKHALNLDTTTTTHIILRTHNASYSRFSLFGNRLHLAQFNGTAHLEHPDRRHALTYI